MQNNATFKRKDTPPFGHPSERGANLQANSFNSYRDIPKNFKLLKRATELRKARIIHEMILWQWLKGKRMCGLDFHREQVIGNYIVDFVCYKINLIIEADGSSHIGKEEYDKKRDDYLQSLGFYVIHIPVGEIFKNLNSIVENIRNYIENMPLYKRGVSKADGVSLQRNIVH